MSNQTRPSWSHPVNDGRRREADGRPRDTWTDRVITKKELRQMDTSTQSLGLLGSPAGSKPTVLAKEENDYIHRKCDRPPGLCLPLRSYAFCSQADKITIPTECVCARIERYELDTKMRT